MKKLILSAAMFVAFIGTSFSQYDIEVTMNTPASGTNVTGTANFTISYTVTNNGPNPVPVGDTVILTVVHSGNNFSLSGTAGSVSLLPLAQAFPSGASISSTVVGANATANLANANGPVCIFATIGLAAVSNPNGDPDDTDMLNNQDCFNAVPASAEISENTIATALAYPNPAIDIVHVAVEGDEVVSLAVYGMDGKVVSTTQGSMAVVAYLPAGLYIYEATTASGTVIRNTFAKN